ncbi:MAG: hypothetical protein ACOXZR_02745 [Bacilli bacterium]|jgi:hypothetical protein
MFKKAFKILGLLILCLFSFFYTEKIVLLVKNQDPIMKKINEYEKTYQVEPVNALIKQNKVIPGINGCGIDINQSYINMKRIGSYNPNMIEYKEIKPELSISNIYDKYLIKGNKKHFEVALIFKVKEIEQLKDILVVLETKKVSGNFFLDGKFIEENSHLVIEIIKRGHEIYNGGYEGSYDKKLLTWTNTMIESVADNKSKYCLVIEENQNVLDLCSINKMHTIKAELLINSHLTFNLLNKNIEKGSMIVFEDNSKIKLELVTVINFLKQKGYKFSKLSNHLKEEDCLFR